MCLVMQKDNACVSYGGKTYVCLMVKNEHVRESQGAKLTCACLCSEDNLLLHMCVSQST